jgi:glycosyltransferase involved in cell wall biosynthesis
MSGAPLILCASTQYWSEAWFRKHHFMQHLSRTRPVAYVEPSRSIVRLMSEHTPDGVRNPLFRFRVTGSGDHPWIITPPRGIPFWTYRYVSNVQHLWWGSRLRRIAHRLGHDRVWLWLYNPHYLHTIPTLRPERVIFDLVDDLGAYAAGSHNRQVMQESVEGALTRADLVIATSQVLIDRYADRTRTGSIHLVPNGVRGDWADCEDYAIPEEIASLPRPRIGLVGALFSYLDYDLLRAAARAFPDGSLILVGPITDREAVASIAAEPNVHLVRPVPQDEVPRYLAGFDLCLCPFVPGAVRRAVNPLKVYEYLALGRPVVATPLESLAEEEVARWIRFAETEEAFVAAIREELANDSAESRAARRRAIGPYRWDALAGRVDEILTAAESQWRRAP